MKMCIKPCDTDVISNKKVRLDCMFINIVGEPFTVWNIANRNKWRVIYGGFNYFRIKENRSLDINCAGNQWSFHIPPIVIQYVQFTLKPEMVREKVVSNGYPPNS